MRKDWSEECHLTGSFLTFSCCFGRLTNEKIAIKFIPRGAAITQYVIREVREDLFGNLYNAVSVSCAHFDEFLTFQETSSIV